MTFPSILLSAPVVSGLPSRLAGSAQAEGNPWWLWIVVLIILAAFAAFMLWWWLRPEAEAEVPSTPVRTEALPVTSPGAEVSPEVAAAVEPEPELEPAIVAVEQPRVEDLEPEPEPAIVAAGQPRVEDLQPEPEPATMAAGQPRVEDLQPEPEPAIVEAGRPRVEDLEPEPEPAIVAAGRPRVEDLQIVEGIGPKIAAVLRDAGVTTFAQLASLDPDRLRQILRDRDPNLVRLADPATWPEQARLAAGGEWEALAGFQQQLKGGRHA